MSDSKKSKNRYGFVQKVWIVGLIFSLIAVILLVFQATFNIFILILAGALIACYFRGIGTFINRKTNWNSKLTLAISVVGSILIMVGIFYLVGATVVSQTSKMKKSFPEMMDNVQVHLNNSAVGREVMSQVESIKSSDKIGTFLSGFFKTTFGGIGDIYIILLLGIFFTISPRIYTRGIAQLVPPKSRSRAKDLMDHLGSGLKKWLTGKFIAMLAVFILTAIGLSILGMPMWLTLSILAGLLNFIPNFGPLAAMIPAVLIALSESPTMAIIVACLYLFVQLIESSFITPQAQQKLIQIPPALIILAQVFVGALTGIWGIIFATPLVLIIMIIVQDLYIKPMNKKSNETDAD